MTLPLSLSKNKSKTRSKKTINLVVQGYFSSSSFFWLNINLKLVAVRPGLELDSDAENSVQAELYFTLYKQAMKVNRTKILIYEMYQHKFTLKEAKALFARD